MFREPVSRLWSYCNMICDDWNTSSSKQLFDDFKRLQRDIQIQVKKNFKPQ